MPFERLSLSPELIGRSKGAWLQDFLENAFCGSLATTFHFRQFTRNFLIE
jgi:hypothetical protein